MSNVIRYLDEENPTLNWMLWGDEAKSSKGIIKNGVVFESRHPMMCSPKYADDFLRNNCFFETASVIDWAGMVCPASNQS